MGWEERKSAGFQEIPAHLVRVRAHGDAKRAGETNLG
jgi:hypothetical protein